LGECGWTKNKSAGIATNGFEKQLLLAQYNKPVVIHCVAAFQEVMILKEIEDFSSMIIHGFSKKEQLAKLLDNGFYISFGKYLLRNPEWNQFYEYSKQSIFLGNGYRRRNN
jgi:TatD DNase family protein